MKKYKIQIEEILQRIENVEARNFEEALEKVEKKYSEEEIVLDWSDFVGVEFRNFSLSSIIFKITEEEILGYFRELKNIKKIDSDKTLSKKEIKKVLDYVEFDEMLVKDIGNSIKDSILKIIK